MTLERAFGRIFAMLITLIVVVFWFSSATQAGQRAASVAVDLLVSVLLIWQATRALDIEFEVFGADWASDYSYYYTAYNIKIAPGLSRFYSPSAIPVNAYTGDYIARISIWPANSANPSNDGDWGERTSTSSRSPPVRSTTRSRRFRTASCASAKSHRWPGCFSAKAASSWSA